MRFFLIVALTMSACTSPVVHPKVENKAERAALLREEIAEYRDVFDLVQPTHWPNEWASGNGLVYTSEYYLSLAFLGDITDEDREDFRFIVETCWKQPGLLKRSPIHPDQEGPDDYIAVLSAARVLNIPEIAKQILDYGASHEWIYNNVTPGERSGSALFDRFPALISGMYTASKQSPPALYIGSWWASIVTGSRADKENHDAWILNWFQIHNAPTGQITNDFVQVWWSEFYKRYPGGISELLGLYFANKTHPLSKYAVTTWVSNE